MTTYAFRASLGLMLGLWISGVSGCTPPVPAEKKGLVSAKLLAPDPVLTVKASTATRATLGIHEWRMYRGKGGIYLTGYDSKGHAVKGIATVFARDARGNIGTLYTRINDGSAFVAGHSLETHQTLATRAIKASSQALVRRAALDLSALQHVARHERRRSASGQAALQAACSEQAPGLLLQSLACLSSQPEGSTSPAQCGIAPLADESGASCMGVPGQRGKNGGFGSLDDAGTSICAPGDSTCAAALASVQTENAIDQRCTGSMDCVSSAGGWVPLLDPSALANGDTAGSGFGGRLGVARPSQLPPFLSEASTPGTADAAKQAFNTSTDTVSPSDPFGNQNRGQIGSADINGLGGGIGFGNNGANNPSSVPDFNAGRVPPSTNTSADAPNATMSTLAPAAPGSNANVSATTSGGVEATFTGSGSSEATGTTSGAEATFGGSSSEATGMMGGSLESLSSDFQTGETTFSEGGMEGISEVAGADIGGETGGEGGGGEGGGD